MGNSPTTLTPPPDPTVAGAVPQSAKERVLGTFGKMVSAGAGRDPNDSPLAQAMAKEHQQRIDIAQKHYKDYQTYTGILATEIDPETGKSFHPDPNDSPEVAEEKAKIAQKYGTYRQQASDGLDKVAGVNKDIKAKLQKLHMLTDHVIKMHPKPQQTADAQTAGQPQGENLPSKIAPPPSKMDAVKQGADSDRLRAEIEDQRALAYEKQKAQTTHDFKMAEIAEAAKDKALNPTGVARAVSPISMSKAREMRDKGMVFKGADGGQELNLDDYDDTMMLVPLQQNGKIIGYSPASQKQTHLTYNNKVVAVPSLNQVDADKMGTTLGQARVGTTSSSVQGVDADTGVTKTERTSSPIAPPPTQGETAAAPSGGGTPKPSSANLMPTAQNAQRVAPLREAMTQLFGDPSQPDFKGLKSYADLADNPESAKHVGSAVQLVLNGLEENEKASGSLSNLLKNYAGVPQALIASQLAINKDVIGKLTPKEMEAFNTIISSYSTVMGLRALTKASAAQFSVKALERDVPVPGMNAFSKRAFNNKMSRLAEEVYTGSKTVPGLSKQERAYIDRQVKELSPTASSKTVTPPPKPGAGEAHPLDKQIMDAVNAAKSNKPD